MAKRKKKKLWIGILVAVVIVIVATVFVVMEKQWQLEAETTEKPIELELVYAYRNAQWNSAIEKTVEDFNQAYPDIHIDYTIHYENKVYENILNTLLARDEMGDIVQLKTPEAYVKAGILGTISKETITDIGVISAYGMNGYVYGVGAVNDTNGIIYNKEIFEAYDIQIPTTYQEFLDVCSKLRRLGITPVGVGGSDLWHMEYWVNHFFRSDILYLDNDWLYKCSRDDVSWLDEEVTVMLTHLQQLFSDGRVDSNWLSTPDGSLAYMMSEGEVAMIYNISSVCEEILRLNPDMELGWFYVPDEYGLIHVGENRDTFWSVTKECQEEEEKYQAAMTFLEFFYSEENYANVRDSITGFPTVKEYADYEMNEIQAEITRAFEENTSHVTGYIGDENCPQGFESQMLVVIQDMLSGEKDIAQSQMEIQTLWENCLAEEVESQ